MINKFLKGGKQQDAVMLFVKGLADTLQADPNEVILLAQNNPDALESAVLVYQQTKGDMKKAAQAFAQTIQKKTKKALHGAKLLYFKDLKNKCADDEELYYYKKGGSLGCGCKKKMEEGGQAPKKSPVDKFRNAWTKKDELKLDSLSSQKRLTPQGQKEKERLQNKFKKAPNRKDYEIDEGKKGMKLSKEDKVCPKCGKVHAAGMGCAVAKFKAAKCGAKVNKHEQGGSLKRIPFYLAGTPKGGIVEKSDNTRVLIIPNNGSYTTETIPLGWLDFVPILGTYREAKRLDTNDPNASKAGLAVSLAGDLAGAGMIGPVLKATSKYNKVSKALKTRGFFKPANTSTLWIKIGTKETPINAGRFGTVGIKTEPAVFTKTVPQVDVSGVALTPLVQTLRIPGVAVTH